MPRSLIKKYLPTHARIRSIKPLRLLGSWLNSPELWKVDRRSISTATAIGLFSAYMPIPFEMLLAALLARLFRGYLPLAIVLVWLSNPFTWVLVYTPPYLLGSVLLGNEIISLNQITFSSMSEHLASLLVGCVIFGTSLGCAGYVLSRVVWRMTIIRRWQNRHTTR